MSPSAYITMRVVKSGKRYVVRYRRGGRMTKLQHGGSFKTRRVAEERLRLIETELAAGRDPAAKLRELAAPSERRTLTEAFDAFTASRIDVAPKTLKTYGNAKNKLGRLADRDPESLTAADVAAWIGDNAKLTRGTLQRYLSTIQQVLDFCEIEPNPARSKRVKLPAADVAEISPPSTAEWRAIKDKVSPRSLLVLRLIEALGLRVSEAVELTYGDIDFAEGRLRVSRARTKRRTAGQRWLPMPDELLDEIADLCPLEDRSRDRRVFRLNDDAVRADLARGCRDAGLAHYHPHDLRHRRVSLWIAHGFDVVTVRTWTGHSHASMTLDRYAHVVIDPNGDEWRAFWLSAYDRERRPKRQLDRTEVEQ